MSGKVLINVDESNEQSVDENIKERVLEQLGFGQNPANNLAGLSQLYGAWCKNVPFDNLRKILHVTEKNTGPLPGDSANDFLSAWLKHRTGGTCWAGNGALYSLLSSVGFRAFRGVGTMLVAPQLPPNHGTVLVEIDNCHYWVDASILHESPIPLDLNKLDSIQLRFKTQLRNEDDRWHIWWLPLNRLDGLNCRLDSLEASRAEFQNYHEQTREWSPFNYELNVRKVVGDKALGIGSGNWIELDGEGNASVRPIESKQERINLLVDRLGYSEEIARTLPPDQPTPPPPMAMRGH